MATYLEKETLNQLFTMYETLLTDKQIIYYKRYYFDDYSIGEIAEEFQISRNAVFDHIKKTVAHLNDYESKLQCVQKKECREKIIAKLRETKDLTLLHDLERCE